jgi:hypothetical protein
MADSPTAGGWSTELRHRLDAVIDLAQTDGDTRVIREAADLLDRLTALAHEATALEELIEELLDRHADPEAGGTELDRALDEAARLLAGLAEPDDSDRPASFLLLPASGEDSGRHFRATVAGEVSPQLLTRCCPVESKAIAERIQDRLGAWGLRDNTRGFPSNDPKPMIWDRIEVGTLALFAQAGKYGCAADVIGKCVSDDGSEELWGSADFRWMIFLTRTRPVSIPLDVVIAGAGFDPGYHVTRQALVPRANRESGLWRAIRPYLEERER